MTADSQSTTPTPDWGPESLERKKFGSLLVSCLRAEIDYSKGSFVVALTAPFGSGKTHFLNAWVGDLRARVEAGEEGIPKIVYINAWDTDFSGEPLLAIIATVLKQLENSKLLRNQSNLDDLKTAGYGLLAAGARLAKDLAIGYVEEKTGVAIDACIAAAGEGSPSDKLERRATRLLEDFETRQRSLLNFKVALGDLIKEGNGDGLFFVVDELDRCKPTYAIEFLEAIKHVFDVGGLGVLLAVDWDQLNSTASALFGRTADSEEYLRKFIQRRAELPLPDMGQAEMLSEHIIQRFFDPADPRQPLGGDWRDLLTSIIRAVGMSARQIETAGYAFARIYYYKSLKEGEQINLGGRPALVPEMFMTCMYAKDRRAFELLREGNPLDQCLDAVRNMRLETRMDEYRSDFIVGRILSGLATESNWITFESLVDTRWPKYKILENSQDVRRIFGSAYLPREDHQYSRIGKQIMQLGSIIQPLR